MHKFLRAIGFSEFKENDEIELFLQKAVSEKYLTASYDDGKGHRTEQYQIQVAPSMGVAVVGERKPDGTFQREYYFPYMRSYDATQSEECSVDRHAEKESYSGVLEDYRTGIALIYYLCNSVAERALVKRMTETEASYPGQAYLTGMAVEGKIILPVEKREEDEEVLRRRAKEERALIEAARNGDEDAIETLTATDMDQFSQASRRLEQEDLYTVVETTLMPTGVECDQYQVLGEILALRVKSNVYTHEKVLDLRVRCNDMIIHICINEADLLGIPAVGRRFKGRIWLQGDMELQAGRK